MSRIGRLPVKLADGVSASFADRVITVKGPLGQLNLEIRNDNINVEIKNNEILVTRTNEIKTTKAAHGMYRALIANMAKGVKDGFSKSLVINGVGYKATLNGKNLVLNIGFSHPVNVVCPDGIKFEVPKPEEVIVKGIDKDLVGQTASDIKSLRKPEPYHGYGIHYSDETILRKEGKANAKK